MSISKCTCLMHACMRMRMHGNVQTLQLMQKRAHACNHANIQTMQEYKQLHQVKYLFIYLFSSYSPLSISWSNPFSVVLLMEESLSLWPPCSPTIMSMLDSSICFQLMRYFLNYWMTAVYWKRWKRLIVVYIQKLQVQSLVFSQNRKSMRINCFLERK